MPHFEVHCSISVASSKNNAFLVKLVFSKSTFEAQPAQPAVFPRFFSIFS